MALANFFEKNALAAHQIVGGLHAVALDALLQREVVTIAIDDAAASTREGECAALLLVDLLARFYPRLRIAQLDAGANAQRLKLRLEERAKAINPSIDLLAAGGTRVIVFGLTTWFDIADTVIYAGTDNWHLRLSDSRPVGSGSSQNPFAAGAVACLAAANVFRAVLRAYLPDARLDRELDVSVVDWGAPFGGLVPPPDLDGVTIDLSETLLGGVGAIGCATVWALARLPNVRGTLRLIDPEVVELSNLQRYVITDQSSIGKRKVELAAAQLRQSHPDLELSMHAERWGAYLRGRNEWRVRRVATAFDSPGDRVLAQGSLPRTLLNAWTQLGDMGVSRHVAFGEDPCLACMYPPYVGGKSEAERVANDLGFEGAPHEIRDLLYTGRPVSEEFIRRVAANLKKTEPAEVDALLRFAGQPLRQFHTETVCGGVMLELGVRPGERAVETPMAFQSALAGIMLALEVVLDAYREATGAAFDGPTRTALDLTRPVPPYPHMRLARRAGCICSDTDYVQVYRNKYENQAAETGVT